MSSSNYGSSNQGSSHKRVSSYIRSSKGVGVNKYGMPSGMRPKLLWRFRHPTVRGAKHPRTEDDVDRMRARRLRADARIIRGERKKFEIGSKDEVGYGMAKYTPGQLNMKDRELIVNKNGHYVSRKKHDRYYKNDFLVAQAKRFQRNKGYKASGRTPWKKEHPAVNIPSSRRNKLSHYMKTKTNKQQAKTRRPRYHRARHGPMRRPSNYASHA